MVHGNGGFDEFNHQLNSSMVAEFVEATALLV